jgi:aspartate carbamoyltransferase catalytic subunit
MTRVQKERFSDPIEYEKVKNVYILREKMLRNTKPNVRVLHPLPRVNEIHPDVDKQRKSILFSAGTERCFCPRSDHIPYPGAEIDARTHLNSDYIQ